MKFPSWSAKSFRAATKEIIEISQNAAFVGGIKYLADKTESALLWWIYAALFLVLYSHINSYVQAPAVKFWIETKLSLRPSIAATLGYILTFIVLFPLTLAVDQAINAIASAQAK